MPTNQALQVFYGSIPVTLVLLAVWFREQTLLKDILSRLGRLEQRLDGVDQGVHRIETRLTVLESRAGVVYKP